MDYLFLCECCDLLGHESQYCPSFDDMQYVITQLNKRVKRLAKTVNTFAESQKSLERQVSILVQLMIQREEEILLNQPGPKNEIVISKDDEEVMDGTESDTWSETEPDTWSETESETWFESGVDAKHESQPSLEKIEVLVEESDSNESEKNLTVLNEEQEMKTPIILGQTLVFNMGEVTIAVHKGNVTIKSGKVEDISKFLNFNNSPSISSYYIDDVIDVNNPPLTCDFY